ncbi:inositol phospholipid synthesis and fat-storage-inducing TM-domain-containing protein [Dissophora ornata]|nr:hypothetical protein BGZ58_002559 [Dissophora ornata]KAI8606604.1 inositol phospholipid synthesis and fat-storage-inducing TM-domain-containing protein [Dissophora ornata]
MEQQASTASIHQRVSPLAEDSISRRDRAPVDSPSLSPIISHATVQELANTPAAVVPPPETPLSSYLLPYQFLSFIFPVTLLFGSLFGVVGGNKPSYFSNKRNILNVLFVKNGWGWTSFVFLVYLAVVFGKAVVRQEVQQQQQQQQQSGSSIDVQRPQEQPHGDQALRTRTRSTAATQRDGQEPGTDLPAPGTRASSRVPTDVILKALVRWGLATLYWWLISQWFFGPGLFDRLFVMTGGSCSVDGHWSQYRCRRMGGQWSGGVDISGHMFLLTHACLFLMEELSVFLNVPEAWTALKTRPTAKYAVLSVVGLCGLWWWMLLMTSVYYHHLAEKLSGLFFGVMFWCCTYVTSYKTLSFPAMPDQAVVL